MFPASNLSGLMAGKVALCSNGGEVREACTTVFLKPEKTKPLPPRRKTVKKIQNLMWPVGCDVEGIEGLLSARRVVTSLRKIIL
jgi:hypothetical protein